MHLPLLGRTPQGYASLYGDNLIYTLPGRCGYVYIVAKGLVGVDTRSVRVVVA